MKIYLVGGAVRDALLGLDAGDRDWVVVGATQAQMQAQGYRPVGRDFPVFLHPHTGEEYALARTERKSGRGYRGFVVDADPSVTLEEDLLRRDFTINAIARDEASGELVDPYGGVGDIERRVLRHVGPAFSEDPLRVLRAARFMARFAPLGFRVAPETMVLMRQIAASGELDTLVPERVWQELRKVLASQQPSAFLRTLHEAGALGSILPELEALYGVPQRAEYHPEIDTGRHQEMVSDMAARLAPGDALTGFAALVHDLGKGLTPRAEWPRHLMHEQRGLKPLQQLCERLKVPLDYRQLAEAVCREHLNVHRIDELRDATVLELLSRCDGFRRPERIAQIAIACECDARGRLGFEERAYPQGATLRRLHQAALAINARDIATGDLRGPAIGEALKAARIAAIHLARQPANDLSASDSPR
ncbi:multifunctional CCA addition/repair protein [Stenotrophomonas sp. YIM B06876]|uniref:multifunctional CCA addition/repair protein n=1 Tax=Stenotrophomonas sp. YIM B06876 TaxID=3060211 RepID=UPI0027399A1C|nr:multifunctional CCA addition/repair protein [Stenotrophomonas sp. YIM B06876]